MPVTLRQAAAELHVHPSTLRSWVRRGAPVSRRGGHGRGRAALYEVQALRAWRDDTKQQAQSYRVLAAEVQEIIADALHKVFVELDGPHKRYCAGVLAGGWYAVTNAVLDHLRKTDMEIPELSVLPEKVRALREVFAQSGKVGSQINPR